VTVTSAPNLDLFRRAGYGDTLSGPSIPPEGPPLPRRPKVVQQAIDRLLNLDRAGALRFGGGDGRPAELLTIELGDRSRAFAATEMLGWLDGFDAGATLPPELAPPPLELGRPRSRDGRHRAQLRSILVNPTPQDQCRIALRLAMQRAGIGTSAMMTEIRASKKAIIDALQLGVRPGRDGREYRYLGSGLDTRWQCMVWSHVAMADVVGIDVARQLLPLVDPSRPVSPRPPDGWCEPDVLARLRLLLAAHERGLVAWVSVPGPNAGLYARSFRFDPPGLPPQDRPRWTVLAERAWPWLVGVADAAPGDGPRLMGQQLYEAGVATLREPAR
jgi:hypothetical protein